MLQIAVKTSKLKNAFYLMKFSPYKLKMKGEFSGGERYLAVYDLQCYLCLIMFAMHDKYLI